MLILQLCLLSALKTNERAEINPTWSRLGYDGAQMNIADPADHASLWKRARAMLARACEEIGEPAALAALASLSNARRRRIAGMIALLECIVRKLLFAFASQLAREQRAGQAKPPRCETIPLKGMARTVAAPKRRPAPTPGAAQACLQSPSAKRKTAAPIDLACPESWRARFVLAPSRDRREARPIGALWVPAPPPPTAPLPREARCFTPAPLRLALRLEALRRVLADPEPMARRLARLMPRLCRRDPRASERYATAPARPHHPERFDARLVVEAISLAIYGVPEFSPDTS